jgi:hypothetical protein
LFTDSFTAYSGLHPVIHLRVLLPLPNLYRWKTFFNNTDLGPANLGQTFTNRLKEYVQQNSSLRVVKENGELQIEGTLTQYAVSPVAPVSGAATNRLGDPAALTRLTISVRVNYVDTLEPKIILKIASLASIKIFPAHRN